jgi:flavin-dependent dehydrogenase
LKSSSEHLYLKDGSQIAVIGAGPAGTFFTQFAQRFAREKKLTIPITLFDAKNFLCQGPSGCNMCAGVVSESLVAKMKKINIVLPAEKVQRTIGGFYYQSRAGGFLLNQVDGKKNIITIFRGNGPRYCTNDTNISFDDFLLDQVKGQGANVISKPVTKIILPAHPVDKIQLIYGKGSNKKTFDADLVVCAFGLNTKMISHVKDLAFGYQPPHTLKAYQSEYFMGREFIKKNYGNNIYIFAMGLKRLRFVAIVPKDEYITVSLVGRRDVNKKDLMEFMNSNLMREILPNGWQMSDKFCHCQPLIATTPAKHPFADRLVIIGDASFSRYYKNGLESAFLTARLAAETAFYSGVSKKAFRLGYYKQAKKLIIRDNLYGRALFKIDDFISQRDQLAKILFQLTNPKNKNNIAVRLQEILWNLFTGSIPYRKIFLKALKPLLQLKIFLSIAKIPFKKERPINPES